MPSKIGERWRGSFARGASEETVRTHETFSAGAHSRRPRSWKMAVACGSVAAIALLAGCGSDSSATSPSPSVSGSAAASGSAVLSSDAGVAAAKAALEPFIGQPTAFPVDKPLSKPLPAGTKFAFLQCSSPVCAQVAKSFEQAVAAIGGEATVVNAGATAQTAQAAASSLLAMDPDVVLLSGADPALYGEGLQALTDAGTKVVSIQVTKDVEPYGIAFNYLGAPLSEQNGKILADWVIANQGPDANTVLYTLPALDLSPVVQKAFEDELAANCPSCTVRTVPIDIATVGTTSSRTIVTDLQANPDTNVAAFVSYQSASGLPAALDAAGLSVKTVGFAPTAGILQDIKDGKLNAGLAIDFPVSVWTAVDAAARLVLGDQPTQGEIDGEVPEQLLSQADITFDPTQGWTGYPDYAERFTTLWHPAGS